MLRYPIKFIAGFFVFLGVLLLGGFYFLGNTIDTFLSGLYQRSGYTTIGWMANSVHVVTSLSDLVNTEAKISQLESEKAELESKLAHLSSVEEENAFLKEALKIPNIVKLHPVVAGVFSIINSPDGHYMLINKGSKDGLGVDDGVISEKGILIGKIDKIFQDYARIMVVTDVNFKTTVVSLEGDVSGIAQGMMNAGIAIDFVAENEKIMEDDTLITNGNDFLPAGLVVGKVKAIEQDAGSLFKKIMVHPSLWEIVPDKVIVIKK